MQKASLLFVLLIFLVYLMSPAANALSGIIISEIAWMGSSGEGGHTKEWVELYNSDGSSVDLSGWMLEADDGSPTIALSGSLGANAYLLLERSLDYTGALANSGEVLRLRNTDGALIDAVESDGWPAGDNDTKQTMERTEGGFWETSLSSGGTPGSQNSVWGASSSPTPPPPAPPAPAPPPSPAPAPPPPAETTADNVPKADDAPISTPEEVVGEEPAELYISELLPDPAASLGSDADAEFVELYNAGELPANLDGWVLRDASGKTKELVGVVGGNAYLVFFAESGLIPSLNNGGDVIELLTPFGVRRDGISYGEAPEGFSLALTDSGWVWTTTPTPGEENRIAQADVDAGVGAPLIVAPLASADSPPQQKSPSPPALQATNTTDGSALAAAILATETSLPETGSGPPFFIGLLFSVLVGVVVFLFRRVRRQKPIPVAFSIEEGPNADMA